MSLDRVEIAVLVGAGLVLMVVLIWVWRSRRAAVQRLMSILTRLGDVGSASERLGLEKTLLRLERAAGATVARSGEARRLAERYRMVAAEVGQGVVCCDDDGEIAFENERAREMLSGSVGPLVREAVTRLLATANAGTPARDTLDLYGPPRTVLDLTARPLSGESEGLGAVVLMEDVTERRRLEAIRRDFVANISHELKTPVGALALLSETMVGESDPELLGRLSARMQSEASRVNRIIDELLDLSRLESEEASNRELVPLHLVVAQAAERVRSAAEQRQIRIRVGDPPHAVSVPGDRRQLVSAVFNLLENAVKYSEEGSVVELGGRAGPGWVELRVSDRGPGIPAHELERIFERFYRVDRSRGRETGGTGLGLAIVRHVARNHGGEVLVESVEGQGSTFRLVLPTGHELPESIGP